MTYIPDIMAAKARLSVDPSDDVRLLLAHHTALQNALVEYMTAGAGMRVDLWTLRARHGALVIPTQPDPGDQFWQPLSDEDKKRAAAVAPNYAPDARSA